MENKDIDIVCAKLKREGCINTYMQLGYGSMIVTGEYAIRSLYNSIDIGTIESNKFYMITDFFECKELCGGIGQIRDCTTRWADEFVANIESTGYLRPKGVNPYLFYWSC